MRSVRWLALLVFCTGAFAETPKSFVDIPFGTPLKSAETTMLSREGVKEADIAADTLTFTGGTFAGHPATSWTLKFPGGKFANGSVLIDKVKKPVYDDIKAQLTKKYGKPDSETGHHSFECIWEFRSDGNRTVRLEYDYKGRVQVTYNHGTLSKGGTAGKKSDL